MNYYLALIAITFAALMADAHYDSHMPTSAVEHQLARHASKQSVPLHALAAQVQRMAKKYDLNQQELLRVILHESKGVENAYNERSDDYGLMQINRATADERHISLECLLDWKCNLEAGAQILSDLHDQKDFRICLYNVGKHGYNKKKKRCLAYEGKLSLLN